MLKLRNSPIAVLGIWLFWTTATPSALAAEGNWPFPVSVSADGRHLVDAGGKPFLLHGDTAWSLMVQLTKEETEEYLENRRQRGFNAILVNLIESYYADDPPKNKYGDAPFTTPGDFSTPNEAYFAHADWVIRKASEKGILVILNPCYTGWGSSNTDGWVQEIVANGPAKGRDYGRYVGRRYQGYPNIVWQAGGDQTIKVGSVLEQNWLEILRGIRDHAPAHLWTAHWYRFTTARDQSTFAPYMSVDNAYGGNRSYIQTLRAYNRPNPKPTFVNEAYYEDTALVAGAGAAPWLRAQAYWALLSGATGHLFGSDRVWAYGARVDSRPQARRYDWRAGLDSPGARAMVHVKRLFEGRRWYDLTPDQDHAVVTGGYGTFGKDDRTPGGDYVTAASTADGSLVMAYVPATGTGTRTITMNMMRLGAAANACWYNPTNGTYASIAGSPFANSGSRDFTTPGDNGTGTNDWVLVLETAPLPARPPDEENSSARAPAPATKTAGPFRVLVVIGDQWDDPGSYCIDSQSQFPKLRARASGKDFLDVVTMLKIWGIPFDILRLDQQRLQINRFLNGVAEPNYGCVIWMADPDKLQGYSAHYETLRRVVEDYGIPLIALWDHIRTPQVAELVGVELVEDAAAARVRSVPARAYSNERLAASLPTLTLRGEHFVTAGMVGTTLGGAGVSQPRIVPCRPRPGTQVLGELQGQPQLVVRTSNGRTKTVWIGGGQDWFDKVPALRRLFRNALVWCMGYGLFNDNFENAFIFVMDDMGCSEHAYSLAWHYPTPSREDIIKYLVEPLAQRGLVLVQNLTPGYANPVTRMVENPWTVPTFTDPFGNVQDYGSTKKGLDEGVRRGVFEIHAHRAWTHLNWDLDSPPGPWWDEPLEGERAHTDWYNETVDTRRSLPVPSNDQLFIYKIGRDAIERQFGVTPLGVTVRPGWGLEHDNGRLAVMAGYGIGRWHYLGPDRVIQFSILDMAPEQFSCHDLDLVEKTGPEFKTPTQTERARNPALYRATRVVGERVIDLRDPNWPDRWKHKRWIGFNEYCAYLHSRPDAQRPAGPGTQAAGGLTFDLEYDPHYCRHFARHPSRWTLELSEDYLSNSGGAVSVFVDGKMAQPAVGGRATIAIPPGVGRHRIQVRAGKGDE